jgi:hypothetical protein
MFGSMIVYPIAILVGLISGLAVRSKSAPKAVVGGGLLAALLGALEFLMYLGTGPFLEVVAIAGMAALVCFVLAIAGGAAGAGVRWLIVAAIRGFRGV